MTAPLEGKVVLITGGARRVGAAISRRLHAGGANLVIHYRSSSGEARALKDELARARAGSVVLIQGDLLKPTHLASLIKDSVKAFGQLDALTLPIGENEARLAGRPFSAWLICRHQTTR